MVGLYSADAGDAPSEELSTGDLPSSTGQVMGAEISSGFMNSLGIRSQMDATAAEGLMPDGIVPPGGVPAPRNLSADEANAQYGIPGQLHFDGSVPETVAQDRSERMRAEIVRQDTIARRPTNVATGAVARTAAELAGGLFDPLNLALGLIPGVPEERIAAGLGSVADTMAGRVISRGLSGATTGAAGMAALQPFDYALTRYEGQDMTMADALRNIAFGAGFGAIGGGLHGLLGGAHPAPEGLGLDRPPDDEETPVPGETTSGAPSTPPDTVRFFHGATPESPPTSGGGRWVTTDPIYARDFRAAGEDKKVWYVDLPKGHPEEVAMRLWDDNDERDGINNVGTYRAAEVSEETAKGFKPYDFPKAPDAGPLEAGFAAASKRMEAAGYQAREAALRVSLAQSEDGMPVDVAPVVDAIAPIEDRGPGTIEEDLPQQSGTEKPAPSTTFDDGALERMRAAAQAPDPEADTMRAALQARTAEPPEVAPEAVGATANAETGEVPSEAEDFVNRAREAGLLAPDDEMEVAAIEQDARVQQSRLQSILQAASCLLRSYV